jgi:hypothetical protein
MPTLTAADTYGPRVCQVRLDDIIVDIFDPVVATEAEPGGSEAGDLPSRPLTGGLRRVSLLVPEASADGLRHLAREYRAGTG